jgi:hypothetical protein
LFLHEHTLIGSLWKTRNIWLQDTVWTGLILVK